MLSSLGRSMFPLELEDEFAGVIATKTEEGLVILAYNYIDQEIVTNYFTRNIGTLKASERKMLLRIIKSDKLDKILQGQMDVSVLKATAKVKNLIKKAQELNDLAKKFSSSERKLKISIKNLKGSYLYERYVIDSSCSSNCEFVAAEKKELNIAELYQQDLNLAPYSVNMIVFKKKPPEPEPVINSATTEEQPVNQAN